MGDCVQLRGVRAVGTHGVLPEERLRAQPFEVDLDIETDLRPAGLSDNLADTIDYGALSEAVASLIGGAHADLLEHLAERIAAKVLDLGGPGALSVTVTLRKLRPPVPVDMASAAVRITRP
jgi:dihydroneopterin aldolase